MAQIIGGIRKDSKVQKDKTQTIEKHNTEFYSTQSKSAQTALIRKVFEKMRYKLGDTIEEMDNQIEQTR